MQVFPDNKNREETKENSNSEPLFVQHENSDDSRVKSYQQSAEAMNFS